MESHWMGDVDEKWVEPPEYCVKHSPYVNQYGLVAYCVTCVSMRDGITKQEAEGEVKRPRCNKSIERASNYEKAKTTWDRELEVLGVESGAAPRGMTRHRRLNIIMKDLENFFGPMEKIIAIKKYDE